MEYGQEEAAARFGADPRRFAIMTVRMEGDASGRLQEVHTVGIRWSRNGGRPSFERIPGTERVWPAQLILLCMGFLGPEDRLPDQLGLERDPRSNIKADFGDYVTSVPGFFAAGDVRRGTEPGGLGHPRRPGSRPGVRPLPHGVDPSAMIPGLGSVETNQFGPLRTRRRPCGGVACPGEIE